MRESLLIIICVLATMLSSIGQNYADEIKGKWLISKFQPCGIYGMTYQMAEMYIGDTVFIDTNIRQSIEENEYTKALGIDQHKCKFNPIKTEKIETPENYFIEQYHLQPILLSIDNQKEMYLINTDCEELLFNEIIYDKTDNRLYINQDGMFFILTRLL